jgi:hypothetical protein
VLADAGGAHVVPALIVMTAFSAAAPRVEPILLPLVAVWSTCLGLKGILWHQRRDREDDLKAGARTFATAADPSLVRAILVRVVYPIELLAFVAMVVVLAPRAPLLAAAFAVHVGLDLVKTALGWSYVFDPRQPSLRRRHLPLVANVFYELWFPLAMSLHLTIQQPVFALLVVFLLGAFWPNVREQIADVRSVAADIGRRAARREVWRRWGWHLEVHGEARAELAPCADSGDGLRVEIERAGTLPWHVMLYREQNLVVRGETYALRFEARADVNRPLTYSLVRGTEPWDSLGVSEEITVTTRWTRVDDRFQATDDDGNARATFLLGIADGSVELRGIQFPLTDRGGETG